MFFGHQRANNRSILVKNEAGLALTHMSASARLKVDWSKTIHISVLKPSFLLIFVCFLATRGPIFVKNYSGLALAPVSVGGKLKVDWSRNFHYIAWKRSVTDDRQTTVFIELLGRS